MAQAQKKPRIEKDEYAPDGVRMFNPSKPHGTVYCDGFTEVKYIQEYEGREVHYRGDRLPVGHVMGQPLPKHADELLEENAQLQQRIADLEASQKRTNELLAKLSAQLEPKAQPAPPAAKGTDDLVTPKLPEIPPRGAVKGK